MGKNRFTVVESNMKVCIKSEVRKVEAIMVNGSLSQTMSIGNPYSVNFWLSRGTSDNK